MKIAVYGRDFDDRFTSYMDLLLKKLFEKGSEVWIEERFLDFIMLHVAVDRKNFRTFHSKKTVSPGFDLMFSIGGDGTFLEAATLVRGTMVPLVGINSGRMGFLAYISKEDIESSVDAIFEKRYVLEKRTLLEWRSSVDPDPHYALNEVSVQKEGSKMIAIHAYVNGELLNSYWADGLIIATPTGSTAYSLSTGGPIVVPGSSNFIVSPISPHTLAVRPVVLPDHHEIKLKLEGRSGTFLLASDYFSTSLKMDAEIVIRKARIMLNTLRLHETSFYGTIRSKLMWGKDRRN